MKPFLSNVSRLPAIAAAVGLLYVQTAAAHASRPRPPLASACHAGQATLKQEPLEIVTAQGRQHFVVEMADNDITREIGLMCRTLMAADRGMLFDFRTPRDVAFWMRNTLIPLDMLFITADGHILSIARNAKPLDETPIPSGGSVVGVLELRGGRAAEIGAAPGDMVRQRIFHR